MLFITRNHFNEYITANKNLDFSNKMKIDFNSEEDNLYRVSSFLFKRILILNKSNLLKYLKIIIENKVEPIEIIL